MGIDLIIVADGLASAFSFQNLIWLVIGVTLGLFAGTLPGFSGGTMMAILLPLVVTLPIDTMLITLAGIYAANVYADSTAGILYNIPGGASGVATTIEGYQLRLKGRVEEAFSSQVGASFVGATIGFCFLIVLVPFFIHFVRLFGSAERALLAVWALIFIATGAISRDDPLRAFISVGVGLSIALIGQQPNIGTFRFTMGLTGLWDGVKVILVVLGLFALPQLLAMIRLRENLKSQAISNDAITFFGIYRAMARLLWKARSIVTKASLFGVFIGVIPGIGTSTASWAGYSVARNNTREPEPFGTGNIDGITGAESASNACEVGTIIPLLSLGIPGSAAAAIMLAALTLVGINPGPSMYANHGAQVWTIMFGIGLSGFLFTVLAYPFIKGAQSMSRLPIAVLVGAISTLCIMGSYLQTHNTFGIMVMLVIGIGMVLTGILGLQPAPLLIGFILGPNIEMELIRAYQIGGFARFVQPTALVILAIIALTLGAAGLRYWRERKAARNRPDERTKRSEDIVPGDFLKEKLLSALALILAAVLLIETTSYPLFASLWVYFVAACFIILPAGLLLARNARSLARVPGWIAASRPMRDVDLRLLFDQVILLAAFFMFMLAMPVLGFVATTVAFLFLLTLYFERRLLYAVVASVIVAVFIWIVKQGFGFYLPTGIVGL